VYEAGFSGFWAHRQLTELGIANSVVHAADVPTSDKERRQKDDPRDSRKLARSLENGELKPIHIPDPRIEELLSLCRLRERSSSHIRRLKNRIKGHLKYYGIPVPEDSAYRHWSGAFIARLEALCSEPGPRSDYLSITLAALREESRRLALITRKLRAHCREGEAARITELLRTIPGIGPKTAFTLYTELQDMGRFANLDKLNSFLGLIPSTASSGEDEKATGITPRANRALRPQLMEAAWVAIRYDPELLRAFSKLASRMKKQAAIVRIARKLAARVAYLWRTGTPYKPALPTG
jgi:transposase